MYGSKEQVEQYNQDNGSGPGLAGYMIWKLDTIINKLLTSYDT